jgi:hypothetical protein
MAEYDGNAIVHRCCDVISGRTRFDADLSETKIADLDCAVVFVNAFWSGPSLAALRDLADIIYELDPIGTLSLIVCDIDCIPLLTDAEWGLETTGGIGEMAWVCSGKIVARHHASQYCDIRTTTRSLLADCPS